MGWIQRSLVSLCCVSLLAGALGASVVRADGAVPFKPFKLKTPAGAETSLADVLGRKATLVVFFFPTCRYCKVALQHEQRFYDTYQAQGLSMVWINAVPEEGKLVPKWQAEHAYTVPVLVGASVHLVQREYKITQTPTAFLLDPAGNIVFQQEGYTPGSEAELERQIKKALE